MNTTTISFEVNPTVRQINVAIDVLKAIGLRPFISKSKAATNDYKMSKEEYFAMIDESIQQAKEGKVHTFTPELKKELFASIL